MGSGLAEEGAGEYGRHVKAVDGYEPVLILDETFASAIEVPETETIIGDGTDRRASDIKELGELK